MSENNNDIPTGNNGNNTNNNQRGFQNTICTTTATHNNTGRPTNVRNRGRKGQRDQHKFKEDEDEMEGHVFTLNTEGSIPLRYHDTMEWLLCYTYKNYKYNINIPKFVEDLSETEFTLPDLEIDAILFVTLTCDYK